MILSPQFSTKLETRNAKKQLLAHPIITDSVEKLLRFEEILLRLSARMLAGDVVQRCKKHADLTATVATVKGP